MPMLVKVLGPAGTFGHEVSIRSEERLQEAYGDIRVDFVKDNTDVLKAAAYSRCIGFVPIYNSDAGLVKGVTDFWLNQHKGFKSHLIGVKRMRVRHQLLVHPSITRPRKQIRAVLSHPHALHQTDASLDALKLWSRRKAASTAEAARLVATDRKWRTTAAIASELAGTIHGLRTWKANIEDSTDNFTVFHIFGPKPTQPTKKDRTEVVIRAQENVDRIARALEMIRSGHPKIRRVRQISDDDASTAAFYCRFDEHQHTNAGRGILREMEKVGDVMVLGSYSIG